MKNIGVLVAVEIEAVTGKYKNDLIVKNKNGFDVYILERKDYRLHFVHSGAGLIRAAAAIQMLCDIYKIDFLINFGVVGALRDDLKVYDNCFVEKVVHYDMDTSAIDNVEVGRYIEYKDIYLPASKNILERVKKMYPQIPVFVAASADKFVHKDSDKKALNDKFGADICDMESAAVILISDINKVPNLIIKTVSDSITGGADEFEKRFRQAAEMCIDIVENIIDSKLI
ncbi:MAG: 5'-methylthioadenosine/S-adenosylhomocysteine nucleosidase [Peptoniphilaceae bacterium]|nr:5'-methylthioadenosine/S-adenosylhomocysteine nucleosidase [Peptoniphilaceae bacterium]MDY6019513.1 5'-methylthioadenosine/S-adenosylhomocysteine nucleosidase [Anaerococcus sp.]